MGSLRGKALAPAARRGFFLGAAEARHPKNQRARLFAEPPHFHPYSLTGPGWPRGHAGTPPGSPTPGHPSGGGYPLG